MVRRKCPVGICRMPWSANGSAASGLPDFGGAGRFEVSGRDEDMVKIAGKRAPLRRVTRELWRCRVWWTARFSSSAGVRRGWRRSSRRGEPRDDVRAALAGRIDPAFSSRPLVIARRASRDANGKLPISELRRCYPQAVAIRRHPCRRGCRVVRGEAVVARTYPSGRFSGHFPDHAIVPGVVLLELVERLLADNGYGVRECPQAKFLIPVAPAAQLSLRVEILAASVGTRISQLRHRRRRQECRDR